ncbi:hypothetical protein K443DRAFT_659084, partial [Laccaria amethystina LaAM-08-1]
FYSLSPASEQPTSNRILSIDAWYFEIQRLAPGSSVTWTTAIIFIVMPSANSGLGLWTLISCLGDLEVGGTFSERFNGA